MTEGTVIRLSATSAFGLAGLLALGLIGFGFLEPVQENPAFRWSFLGWGVALLLGSMVVCGLALPARRTLDVELAFRRQHYVQAGTQALFFAYWGWYWRPVYESAFLIAAQILFAYAFDMLLSWSRRRTYRLGFGPVPVVLSINLFLWFVDEWFSLQFLLVAVGFAAKELIRWHKDGRQVHVFNPSSFSLAVFSLGLIATGASDLTWGQDIATAQFFPPHVYLVLFLVAIPGQFLFGVASMTMSAVVTTYLFGLLYFEVTGVYFFYDAYIPVAVFLGMHLLFTDPSTAPRTDGGRIMFGALYGLGTVALYAVLGWMGVPTFYDKLLHVPILNLSIQWLDRLARSSSAWRPGRHWFSLSRRSYARNFAYLSVWATVFAAMSAVQGVGDRHPGQWVPFWQQACQEGRPNACRYLAGMHQTLCGNGSGWACNEAGVLHVALSASGQDPARRDPTGAMASLGRGCELGFALACQNLATLEGGFSALEHGRPTLRDYPLILRGTKGPVTERTPAALYARACRQGWSDACGATARD